MGIQTTFSTISRESGTESAGSKVASSVSEVMKTPKNMFLLAETGVFMERLHALTQAAIHTLDILQRARAEGGIPLPRFTQMLCKEVDAGETLLNRCQNKVNELVGLHLDSCSNSHIQKLVDKLPICKKEVINVREMSKHFLPVRRTEPQMLQPSQDLTESTSQQKKSSEVDPEEDPLFVPEDSHSLSSTVMEQREARNLSSFLTHRIKKELSICQSFQCPGLVRFPVLSQIKPQAPLLVVPFRQFL